MRRFSIRAPALTGLYRALWMLCSAKPDGGGRVVNRILCLLIAFGTIAFGASTARTADLGLPRYTPAPTPAYGWTGFYVGINGGFGGDEFKYPFTVGAVPALGLGATTGTSTLHSSGFLGGVQAGYNWQVSPAWLIGAETDFDAADIDSSATTSTNTFSGSIGTKLDWFGTVRGRVGVLVTPATLLYGTGGWAYGHATSSANITAFGLGAVASTGHVRNGWTAGAGLEYAITPSVSFKTEYLFLALGTDVIASGALAGVPFSLSEKTTVHTVKAGLNLRFGS
jgi:outer membrane immunogenic protein